MELRGEEKEIRIPASSIAYNPILQQQQQSSSETLDPPPPPHPDQIFRKNEPKSSGLSLKAPLGSAAKYGECLKNHAAGIGGNVVDGCGEFMASGEEGTIEALKCAACNCHRNFHRKKVVIEGNADHMVHPLQLHPPLLPSPSQSVLKLQHHQKMMSMGGVHTNHWMASMPQPVKMAFCGGAGGGGSAGTESSSEDLNNFNYSTFQSTAAQMPPSSKKRFRTKFTQDQKEKMMEFAERVGWRIPKEDDTEIQSFCAQVGVKRQVFKVWMHNNKSLTKQQQQQQQQQEQES